jgi:hypothetical protein
MFRKRKFPSPHFRLPVPYNPIGGEQHHLNPPMRPYCRFILTEALTTADERAEAEIREDRFQFGPGMYHLSCVPIIVRNLLDKNETAYEFSGEIDDIWAEVVYEGDEFEEEKGLTPRIAHKPCRDFAKRGGLLAAYAVARFKGGATRARVIYGDEIEKVKQLVKKRGGKLTGPWIDHEAEMWKKTAIIRLCKTLPMSVARVAEEVERSEEVGDVLDGSFVEVETPPAIEQQQQSQQPEPPSVSLTAEQAIERFNILLGIAVSIKECGDALDWLLPPDDSNPYKLASAQQKTCVAAFQSRQAEARNK